MGGAILTQVTIRRANVGDVEHFHGWRSEPTTSRYQPVRTMSRAEIRTMLLERAETPIEPSAIGSIQWTVEAAREPVGWLGLEIEPGGRRHGVANIAYTVSERYRRQGFARAAVAALLPIAFAPDLLNLERLEAVAAVENVPSRRVLEGAGFQFEGVRRGLLVIAGVRVDHAMYGLLRADWETR